MKVNIQFRLEDELRMLRLNRLNFDSNFRFILKINSLKYLAESALIDFLSDKKFVSNFLKHKNIK